ncbi:MAG TPA: adenylyltransferase/cytidyltransferase family protein [Opitutaceae bacterium]|nr:adenylyltransferase/cytidyltransferase family protein [Opitutaceae bacterium]
MTRVIVSSGFDQLDTNCFRFLEEAAKLGEVHVLLWADQAIRTLAGREPRFPQAERIYVIGAVRHVSGVQLSGPTVTPDTLPPLPRLRPDFWAIAERDVTPAKQAFCRTQGMALRVINAAELVGLPEPRAFPPSGRKKVVVTGCFDLFHSGHVRFFEECAERGDLYVVVGNDDNIRQLKGPGHPLFTAEARRYMAGSIRHVTRALIASGSGWMDAAAEVAEIKPDVYVVNEDGDRVEKRAFCREHGIEYVVLKRLPKPGLVRRTSTDLRGF